VKNIKQKFSLLERRVTLDDHVFIAGSRQDE